VADVFTECSCKTTDAASDIRATLVLFLPKVQVVLLIPICLRANTGLSYLPKAKNKYLNPRASCTTIVCFQQDIVTRASLSCNLPDYYV